MVPHDVRPERKGNAMVFQNRTEAGRWLAEKLLSYATCPSLLVLGIAPGGIPVAGEVARVLRAPLEVLVLHPLKQHRAPEPAHAVLTRSYLWDHHQDRGDVEGGNAGRFGERVMIPEQSPQAHDEPRGRDGPCIPTVRGRTVLLIDEGMATGTTMQAAITMLRPAQPARLIIATPVASLRSCQQLCTQADALVCLQIPQHFSRINDWYGAPTGDQGPLDVPELRV
jgi:putative phosphoribosyl transferase